MRGNVRRSWQVALAFFAASAVGVAAAAPAGASVAKLSAGKVRKIPTDVDPSAVACPPKTAVGSETCYVLATTSSASLLVPVVKGKPQSSSISVPDAVSVACGSSTTCLVAESTSSGGVLQWLAKGTVTKTVDLKGSSYLWDVACESATTCVVAGEKYGSSSNQGVIAVVTESESSPSAETVAGVAQFEGVSCPTASSCVAVGSTTGTSDGKGVVVQVQKGKVGKPVSAAGTDGLEHVSCGSSQVCWATGTTYSSSKGVTTAIVLVRKGKPGSVTKGPEWGSDIACVSKTTCLFASGTAQYKGKGVVDELDNGKVVHALTLSAFAYGSMTGVVCPTSSSCLATGATGFHNPGPDYYYTGAVVTLSL